MVAAPNPQVDPAVDAPSPTGWRLWLDRLTHDDQGRTRLAAFGAILVLGFLAAAVLLSAFAWLASEVLKQDTAAMDNATLQSLQRFSSPQLTLVANLISAMGSQVVLAV